MTAALPRSSGDEDTLIARLIERVAEAPQRTAFEFLSRDGVASNDRIGLLANASAWAHHYRRCGLAQGDLVIVILDHRPQLLYAYLGAMLAGCVPSYMPYSTIKQDRALYVRSHLELFGRIGARALVTTAEWRADFGMTLGDEGLAIVLADEVPVAAAAEPAPNLPANAARMADIALLQHSSGTTALKKGVALSHRGILDQADAYRAAISIGSGDCVVSWLPLYHDMGLMACFLLPLINGATVVMLDPFVWVREPHLLFAAIEQHRGTFTWLPNFAYHHLCRICGDGQVYDLSRMRAFIDCSEPCRPQTFRLFHETFAHMGVRADQLQTCYAMAENCFAVTQSTLGEPARVIRVDREAMVREGIVRAPSATSPTLEFLSSGRVIDQVGLRVVDAERRPLAEDRIGEIAVSGASLFSGYFRLAEETSRVLHDGWYYSGDLGFMREGELYVTGRIKDLIIIRGRNFYAHDAEAIASGCAGVKPGRAVVLGVFNETLGTEEAIVIAEQQEGDAHTPLQISGMVKRTLNQQLGLQVRSVHVVSPGWLIKTTSGKISRSENLAKYLMETRSRETSAEAGRP